MKKLASGEVVYRLAEDTEFQVILGQLMDKKNQGPSNL